MRVPLLLLSPRRAMPRGVRRLRSLPIKPTNLKLADIKKAVERATLEERAAKTAKGNASAR